jgi:uncharacterized protein YbjT (DUF2867 family)
MKKVITVAGATGNLGERIVQELVAQGAEVRAIVRESSDKAKVKNFQQMGVKVFVANPLDIAEMTKACEGATCVVSALSGLREVIIDAQKVLLDAAVAARVPRFIPSDYSLDFRKFRDGENRNLDLRRTFHTYLDAQPIAATTIFNGAFADMLTNEMPMILFDKNRILYWGEADHKMSFTTIADVARFTAHAALDDTTPRFLSIAGDQISPTGVKNVMSDLTGQPFKFFHPGGQGLLGVIIKIARTIAPAKNDLYPAWQGMQYMHNMIDPRSDMPLLDNNRYPSLRWTTVKDVLTAHQKRVKS